MFAKSKLPVSKIMKVLYEWSRGGLMSEIAVDVKVSREAVVVWAAFARQVMAERVGEMSQRIGGEGCVVEIDETLITHRKYNVGRIVKQQWLFGGVVRGRSPPEFFVELVPDRKRETLVEVLKRRVDQDSIVIHDEWRSYMGLSDHGFVHYSVNHSRNFVDPTVPDVHTQNVESLWSRLKAFFRRNKLCNRVHLEDYLAEFVFRATSNDVFIELLGSMRAVE